MFFCDGVSSICDRRLFHDLIADGKEDLLWIISKITVHYPRPWSWLSRDDHHRVLPKTTKYNTDITDDAESVTRLKTQGKFDVRLI